MNQERMLQDIAIRNGMWAAAADLAGQNRIEHEQIVENFGMHIIQGVALGSVNVNELRTEMYALSRLDKEVVDLAVQEFIDYLDTREACARRLGHHITRFAYKEVRSNDRRRCWGVRLRGGKLSAEENIYAIN